MKRSVLKFVMTTVLAIVALIAFAQDTGPEALKRDTVMRLSQFRLARIDSAADFKFFRNEAQIKIADNRKKIAALRDQKSKGTKDTKAKYKEQLSALDHKNDDMEVKIHSSDMTQANNWKRFKLEFDQEMAELMSGIRKMEENKNNP